MAHGGYEKGRSNLGSGDTVRKANLGAHLLRSLSLLKVARADVVVYRPLTAEAFDMLRQAADGWMKEQGGRFKEVGRLASSGLLLMGPFEGGRRWVGDEQQVERLRKRLQETLPEAAAHNVTGSVDIRIEHYASGDKLLVARAVRRGIVGLQDERSAVERVLIDELEAKFELTRPLYVPLSVVRNSLLPSGVTVPAAYAPVHLFYKNNVIGDQMQVPVFS